MSADVEPGVKQPQTKECRQPSGVGRDKSGFPLSASVGVGPAELDLSPVKPFWTADLQKDENINVCFFTFVVICYTSPRTLTETSMSVSHTGSRKGLS